MFRGLSLRIFTVVCLVILADLTVGAQRRPETSRITSSPTSGTIVISGKVQALGAIPASAMPSVEQDQAQQAAPSQPTAGLTIVPTFDPSVPPAMQTLITTTIVPLYQNTFTDPITVPILFRFATTDACNGSAIPTSEGGRSNFQATFQPWTTYINALAADTPKSANDNAAFATLPPALSPNVVISTANGRAVGLPTPAGASSCVALSGFDGIVTLQSATAFSFTRPPLANTLDAQRVLEHEIDEVLGIGSYLDIGTTDVRPEDIWTFSGPTARNITTVGTRYFSLDNGNTSVILLNQVAGADHGDWDFAGCPSARPLVQDATICAGQSADVSRTTPEGIVLDVIGYNLSITSAANVGISGRVLTSAGAAIRRARITIADQNGRTWAVATNAFGYYSLNDIPSGQEYTVSALARGFTFQPRLVSVTDAISAMDIVALP
ncbi:MAG: NF038122 family metalloprotease [Pyrinomonadaceae bacterium]